MTCIKSHSATAPPQALHSHARFADELKWL